MQLEESVMKVIDRLAEEHEIPKQKLVSAILRSAIENQNLLVVIEDTD